MPVKKILAPWEEAAQNQNEAPWETASESVTKPGIEQFTASNLVEALLPRTVQTNKTGKNESTFRNLTNTLLDIGSLPFRTGTSAIGTAAETAGWLAGGGKFKDMPIKERFIQSMGRTGGTEEQGKVENLAEDILRSPANVIPGIGGLKILSKTPTLSKIAQGAITGAESAGIHQAEKYGKGEKISVPSMIAEIATSAAIPAGSGAIKKGAGKASEKIMSVAAKVKPSLRKKEAIDFQKMFNAGIRPGVFGNSLENLHSNLTKRFNELEKNLQEVVKKGENIEMVPILLEDIPKKLSENRNLMPIRDQIDNQFKKMIANYEKDFKTTDLTSQQALQLKRIAGREGAWISSLDKAGNVRTGADPEAAAREIVYNELFKAVNEKLKSVTSKEFQEINKQFTQLIPVEKAIRDRIVTKKNLEVISLSDLLYGGMAGGLLSSGGSPVSAIQKIGEGDLGPLAAIAAGVTASKMLRSPKTASVLNRLSNQAIISEPLRRAGAQITRNILFNPER
jgi:hypothetical protein